MARRLVAIGALALSGGACAQPATQHVSFQGEGARIVLTTLAADAGLRLANPEVITGKLDASFGDETPSTLLARFAWRMGYETRIRDGEVWLSRASHRDA